MKPKVLAIFGVFAKGDLLKRGSRVIDGRSDNDLSIAGTLNFNPDDRHNVPDHLIIDGKLVRGMLHSDQIIDNISLECRTERLHNLKAVLPTPDLQSETDLNINQANGVSINYQ